MDAKLLPLNKLADSLGLPAAWLEREADAGRLPCIRAGKRRMFDPEAVLRALGERATAEAAVRAKREGVSREV
jgi:hypothetical protein